MISIGDLKFNDLNSALSCIAKDNDQRIIIDLNGYHHFGQLEIDKPNITLKNGVIECNLGAYEILSDGYKRGTFRTYTLYINAKNVTLDHVNVINSNGYMQGQSIALMVDGDNFKAKDCYISSYQDTLFIAPLPDKEYEERGFIGPLKDKERIYRKTFFENCIIEGSIDFIFGGGLGYFKDCEIRSRNIGREINGYVCAPSTAQDEEYGFIFDSCFFTSEEAMEDSVYLGRPWRDYGKCFILNSEIGKHIKPEGYHDWDKPGARIASQFKEYNNRNLALVNRVEWMKEINKKDLQYINSLKEEMKNERD